MNIQKSFTLIIIIAALFAAMGLGGTWFLYTKIQPLMAERADLRSKLVDRDANIDKLKNEKARSEQELAVLKASDVAKDVELLRLKISSAEGELAKMREEVAAREAIMTKIRLYADAVAALDQNLAPPPPTPVNSNLKNIGIKIGVLNDSEVSDQWGQAKSAIDAGGDGAAKLINTYFLVISKMRKLLP